MKIIFVKGRLTRRFSALLTVYFFWICGICFAGVGNSENRTLSLYDKWVSIGNFAAEASLNLISKVSGTPEKSNLIVMTNAGYAEVNGVPTQGALDGVASRSGASRGKNTLLEIHADPWQPLWFAVFDKDSGFCAYIETDPSVAVKIDTSPAKIPRGLFNNETVERIDAEYLYGHSEQYREKFKNKVFGGNEFRIITIANAVASGAPSDAVRAFEFHDHYCPGVTSGILMARYLKRHFPPGKKGYFVHSVDPWCKEDALMVLLNATPGKKRYAVSYPTDADKAEWNEKASNGATIVYRHNGEKNRWEGLILAFESPAETSCSKSGVAAIDKLCTDLWYLKHLEKPEEFVKVVKAFEMPEGTSPKDWARPGVDPMKMPELAGK